MRVNLLKLILILAVGCGEIEAESLKRIFKDELGRIVEIPENPKRIVTVATADIEILFAIGAGDKLVGRPHYLKYPKEALRIDNIGGLYECNFEKIVAKDPDLVIMSTSSWDRYKNNLEKLEKCGLAVVGFNYPESIEEILHHIKVIGDIAGKKEEAEKLVKDIESRIDRIKRVAKKLKSPTVYREGIYYPERIGYTSTKGSRDDALIHLAGGENIFSEVKKEKPWFIPNPEEVIERNPQVIIITADLDKFSQDEIKKIIKKRPGWGDIEAVKNNRIYVVEDQLSWANPRIILGLEEFAKAIHPGVFNGK